MKRGARERRKEGKKERRIERYRKGMLGEGMEKERKTVKAIGAAVEEGGNEGMED